MNKLPVFKTIGQTFGFVVERRFFTLLRLVWLPSLIAMVISLLPTVYLYYKFGVVPQKVQHQIVGFQFNLKAGEDPTFAALDLVNSIASIVLGAIVAVSIHRLILLDDRRPGTFFYFRLTKQEWLYMLAWIVYFVAILLAFAPFFGHLAYASLGFFDAAGKDAAKELGPMFDDPRTGIALGLGLLFALVVLVRFGLAFPIIVAEDRLSFGRSWVLTRGNFWRLIGFWILVAILGFILLMIMAAVAGVAVLAIVGSVALGQTVGALGVLVFLVPAAVAFLVYFVVAVAIFVAALSFSYKALAGQKGPAEAFE